MRTCIGRALFEQDFCLTFFGERYRVMPRNHGWNLTALGKSRCSTPPSLPPALPRPPADTAVLSVQQAVEWITNNAGNRMLVLQREDHVKFGFGASGRATR